MLHLMPKPGQLPSFMLMVEDVGNPTPLQLSIRLGMSERQVRRWYRAESAPLAVLMALFWVSRWGKSLLDAELFNSATINRELVGALRYENEKLRRLASKLGHIGEFGSANDPAPEAPAGRPQPAPTPTPASIVPPVAKPVAPQPVGMAPDEWARLRARMHQSRTGGPNGHRQARSPMASTGR
jgi:hypothetical protein